MTECHIITEWELGKDKIYVVSISEEPNYVTRAFDDLMRSETRHLCQLSKRYYSLKYSKLVVKRIINKHTVTDYSVSKMDSF